MAMTQPHDQTVALSVCDTNADFELTLDLILDSSNTSGTPADPRN